MTTPPPKPSPWITYSATCGGVGFAPIMPGTVGSLLAFPLWWGILRTLPHASPLEVVLSAGGVAVALLFFFGVYVTGRYAQLTGKDDPKEAVIDEVAGQLLVLVATHPYCLTVGMIPWRAWLACFILFRAFDIIKPWPIRWCEDNLAGGWGIMVDDIVAAVCAVILFTATIKYHSALTLI